MNVKGWQSLRGLLRASSASERFPSGPIRLTFSLLALLFVLLLADGEVWAQVSVLTAHNDIGRTGQNLNETALTPSNVNATQFGRLFSQPVSGNVYAQPLYVSQLAIAGTTHNVVYVETTNDQVYAFDADTNGGTNGSPLWQVNLLTNTTPAGTLNSLSGVWGTPVIDTSTNTMYLVSSETQANVPIFRFHALNIKTGAEKFGGPLLIQASTPGTGSDSTGGVLNFDPTYQKQRAGLLEINGIVYVGFGSNNDEGPWHGWIFSYGLNPTTQALQQISFFCTSPNGTGDGIWMGGAGLAGEVYNPQKPYGRMFVATANGTYGVTTPYVSGESYGMSVLDLDLTGGVMTVQDVFTPFNQKLLDNEDGDLGSGGPLLLPTQTLASGQTLNPLIQMGKSGMFYVLDRDNNADGSNNAATEYSPAGLGGYNATADQIVQEVQTPIASGVDWGSGIWGDNAYWNHNIYSGGTNVSTTGNYTGTGSHLTAWSFVNGVLSSTATSQSNETYYYPGPTPSISANGVANGIVWSLLTYPQSSGGPETLLAYDATNLANTLYSSATNLSRDNPGIAMKYAVPTIANGKVYVGAGGQLSIYGLLANTPVAPVPSITPGSGTFNTPPTVTITDSVPGATIYYTTNGTAPSITSNIYQGPFPVATNQTITAIASAPGYLVSGAVSATYTSSTIPANPVFSLAAGTYVGNQTLSITDATPGAVIYYTINGPAPTTSSAVYTQPLTISSSANVQAIAVTPGPYATSVVSANYLIEPAGTINFTNGFSLAIGPMKFNGDSGLDDFRLQLTDGGQNEASSVFYATPVNVQQFTNQFTFQLSNPSADGITFTIQGNSPSALGGPGGSLGYAGIPESVAVKFDLFSNAGEGSDSTGLYTNGAMPTLPSIDLTNTGINLHSGDYINVNMTYDGTTLTMTLTDAITLASWTKAFTINIPAVVGGNTAYVGFTGGTGGLSSSQKLTSWLYVPGPPVPSYETGFAPGTLTLNGGATINGTSLELTDGGQNEQRSAFFTIPVNIQQFNTAFNFQLTKPNADGFTFTIQGNSPSAVGGPGGSLGYNGVPESVAVKFDLFSNQGEGSDSTGIYTNGASPMLPSIDLSSTGINFHSGDIFNAQLTYNGVTLTVVITDTVTNASATQNYTINIPATVGGSTAYVGFTGGTGGATAIQQILNWSFSSVALTGPAYSNGFYASPQQMTYNGGAVLAGSAVQLTDGGKNETRSAFYTSPVNVQQFSTNFDFQLTNANADGFTFTIQGDGPTAVGGGGGGLGFAGLANSVGVKFDLYSNAGEGADSTGLYTNGASPELPSTDLTASGVNLHSGDILNAQLTYNGTTLTVVITDTVTNASATQTYTVNIPSIVGGSTAYVGFTGASGGVGANQQILNWTYTSVPLPPPPFYGGSPVTLNGGATLSGTTLTLTDGNQNEARSAFGTAAVNIQQFSTSFNFQLINASADGFTFTIQGNGPTSVGTLGGSLGYSGITQSLAIKFDLFSNAGEGQDSTGMYTNGAAPTVPATDLSSTGINFHSGDTFNAQLAYNGTTLTVIITDTVTSATVTQTYTVNIPAIVGGPTAYIGFTGGTGGATAIQKILSWSYTP